MKCPKCHYLSFDPEPRCRNCGYTLELDPDLVIHPPDEDDGELPLVDFEIRHGATTAGSVEEGDPGTAEGPGDFIDLSPRTTVRSRPADTSADLDIALSPAASPPAPRTDELQRQPQVATEPAPAARPRRPAPPTTTELPLFVKQVPTHEPDEPAGRQQGSAVASAPVDRPPRREPVEEVPAPPPPPEPASPAPRRARREGERLKLGPLDRDLLEGLERLEKAERQSTEEREREALLRTAAPVAGRLGAAAVDAGVLGGLAALILTVTLEWVGLGWTDWARLPLVPLGGFVLLIVLSYLVLFTAVNGQSPGKMLMQIRVVDGRDPAGPVSVGQALVRSIAAVPSVLLAGLGFLPALLGDRRAIHDRVAGTRVIRA